jgi:excisionase family DNA binding protein
MQVVQKDSNAILLSEARVKELIENAVETAFERHFPFLHDDKTEELLDIQETSLFIKRPKKSIYSLVAQRRIPHVKMGKRLTFFKSDLIQWLESYRIATVDEINIK